mmetsp:Transcript_36591/g.95532  ORF Transcript_36591/g.95532 Transcript_36591/m.95532 type:complete len:133 (+) Transcript_36591:88-486(+)
MARFAALLLATCLSLGAGTGLTIDVLQEGDGIHKPETGDTVTVHYVGTLADGGSKFDSSRDRDEPFTFVLGKGEVIEGWDEGVAKMSLGEKAVLHVPSDMAYGDRGFPPVIPPGADLDFEVELLKIEKPATA